ncbi:hypothetical protein [Salipaludibacillus agaradhaerens]|uniref:hypothetical protein n=1 Tax=Salipaludibacillus agaradhaerens TaxID=76935 RepID=UPI000997E793|nr:hypothetical protein [Salipaludibacillus agaradhaerens]
MRKTKYDYDNCIGKTFNDLIILKEVDRKKRRFVCKCVCGSEKEYNGLDVLRGHTKNCGCARRKKMLERNKNNNPVKFHKHESKYPYDECIGKTVNSLTFIKEIERSKYNRRQFMVQCECGKEFSCEGIMVFNGSTRSCGCFRTKRLGNENSTHRLTGTPEHQIWASMLQRCINSKSKSFNDYGGRGIKVCDRWLDFTNFLEDMGKRPTPNHSIDRIDVNGNYEPLNCTWSTRIDQNRNQRLRSDNSTGVKGVSRSGRRGESYLVRINVENRRITIGSFKTLEEAKEARKQAEIKYWGKSSL